ncbi:hypothetical protein C7974DRAFT_107635 [Boeremia exigua]|uniref:uncharacterized protein n=1 Tax=Boeremia exigua TaxID=749465 RepID=UPI001E8DC4D7|nr:uncharacterized protein C7974DRAFT_107635 [Boeremia exigua]KAH6642711.1 hypothetical protein C7974DRAFT_107635 [Boeremia exigua]
MTSEPFTLRWGILATGGIATTFAKDLLVPPSTRAVHDIHHTITAAASSSSLARATTFLHSLGVPAATPHASYAALVRDENVDIIYIATPHSHHYAHALLALHAGKHVLVEKPVCVTAAQARRLYALAKEKQRFVMEAVWTRFFPLFREIQGFVREGRLGTVKRVHADLSFWNGVASEFGTEHRMVNTQLAGGALLDLGLYSLTWVFGVLWHLQAQDAAEREAPRVKAAMSLYSATGCDEMTAVLLEFRDAWVGGRETAAEGGNGDAHAVALTNIRVSNEPNLEHPGPDPVRIQGTLGDISVAAPSYRPLAYTLTPAKSERRGRPADFEYERKTFEIPGGHGMFWEADECARCIRDGKLESEVIGWEESIQIMEVMDEVRRQGELKYPEAIESVEYPLEGFGL